MSEDDSHDVEEVEEEIPFLRIYEGDYFGQKLPNFDAVTIVLDGKLNSDLSWQHQRSLAKKAMEAGFWIFWDLQLGLFDLLMHPLEAQSQFLSLSLAVEHFRDSLWKEFKSNSAGLSLYRGRANFSEQLRWDPIHTEKLNAWFLENRISKQEIHPLHKILYCRDICVDYLSLLVARVPDTLPIYLFLDITPFATSTLAQLMALNPEKFSRFSLALRGHTIPFKGLGWLEPSPIGYSGITETTLPKEDSLKASIAICIPQGQHYLPAHYEGLDKAIEQLQHLELPLRLISESELISQWEGLDYLIYCPNGLDLHGKRKLQGFCAAGGTVISSTNQLSGLPFEMTMADFFSRLVHD